MAVATAPVPVIDVNSWPDGSLILLSDGVIEARDATGELFGFERTQAISHSLPEEIAKRAEIFGQEDDITVVRLSFSPENVSSRGGALAGDGMSADATMA